MNKKLMIGLALGALMLSVMACGIDLGSNNPMPTLMATLGAAQPTYTPYPTQVPPTAYPTAVPPTAVPPTKVPPTAVPAVSGNKTQAQLDSYLVSLGFYNDGYQCSTPCHSFTYKTTNVYVSVITYADRSFTITSSFANGYDTGTEGALTGEILLYAADSNVNQWAIDNMQTALSADQDGMVDGYSIRVSWYTSDSGIPYFMVIVLP